MPQPTGKSNVRTSKVDVRALPTLVLQVQLDGHTEVSFKARVYFLHLSNLATLDDGLRALCRGVETDGRNVNRSYRSITHERQPYR